MAAGADAAPPLPTPPGEATAEQVEALLEAARYDDIDDLISLCSQGVPINSRDYQGRTALHMAAANGYLNIVEYLIQNGSEMNALNSEKNTPLHWACLNGHVEVVKLLMEKGASASILNSYERTPIDEAVSRGKLEVVDTINAVVTQNELSEVELA